MVIVMLLVPFSNLADEFSTSITRDDHENSRTGTLCMWVRLYTNGLTKMVESNVSAEAKRGLSHVISSVGRGLIHKSIDTNRIVMKT